MELLIAIAIVAILAAIAIPTYLHYTKKAYYSEVVMAADPFKTAVAACVVDNYEAGNTTTPLTGCSSNAGGVPQDVSGLTVGAVKSIATLNGVITVVPIANHGILAEDTLTFTAVKPAGSGQPATWKITGAGAACSLTKCMDNSTVIPAGT